MCKKIGLVIVALALAVCLNGSTSGAAVKLAWWDGLAGPNGPLLDEIIEKFNASQTEIVIERDVLTWDVMQAKLLASFSAGNPPDIVSLSLGNILEYADLGVLYPLDQLIAEEGLELGDFVPQILDALKYKGNLYAIPFSVLPYALYLNVDMYNEAGLDVNNPPKNYREYVEYAKKLTIKDAAGKVTQWGTSATALHENLPWLFVGSLYQNGGRVLNSDKSKAIFNGPEGVQAIQWWRDLVFKYNVAPPNEEDPDHDFEIQKVAMNTVGPWRVPSLWKAKVNFATVSVPQFGKELAAMANSNVMSIISRKDPKRLKASMKAVRFVLDNSLIWCRIAMIPPTYSLVEKVKHEKHRAGFIAELSYLRLYPIVVTGFGEALDPETQSPIRRELGNIMLGKKSPQEGLNDAVEEINNILKRYR